MLPEMTCIIIDDEPKSIDVLQQRLSILFPNIRVLGTYTDWKSGIEPLRNSVVDLLFLDISMPEKSGIDFLKLFPNTPFQVIFITAHSEYAIDAIKLSAAGYILKPIDDYELSFAVNKAMEKIKGGASAVAVPQQIVSNKLKIGIPNSKGIDYLNIDEILYLESVKGYTKVVTKEYSIVSSYNLAEFKKILDASFFFQVHRSYVVNLYHVRRYETTGNLVMEDNMQIPVAKNERTDFMAAFNKITKIAGIKIKNND